MCLKIVQNLTQIFFVDQESKFSFANHRKQDLADDQIVEISVAAGRHRKNRSGTSSRRQRQIVAGVRQRKIRSRPSRSQTGSERRSKTATTIWNSEEISGTRNWNFSHYSKQNRLRKVPKIGKGQFGEGWNISASLTRARTFRNWDFRLE